MRAGCACRSSSIGIEQPRREPAEALGLGDFAVVERRAPSFIRSVSQTPPELWPISWGALLAEALESCQRSEAGASTEGSCSSWSTSQGETAAPCSAKGSPSSARLASRGSEHGSVGRGNASLLCAHRVAPHMTTSAPSLVVCSRGSARDVVFR